MLTKKFCKPPRLLSLLLCLEKLILTSMRSVFPIGYIYDTCCILGFPGGSVGKESTCNAGDPGLISGSGRSAGEGIGYPLRILGLSCGSAGKESTCNVGNAGSIPGLRNIPWKRKWQSTLAWEIPWTEKPDGLQSMGSQKTCILYFLKDKKSEGDHWIFQLLSYNETKK